MLQTFTLTGNDKLGKCVIVNRPVGDTCPTSCPFLAVEFLRQKTNQVVKQVDVKKPCYAEKTEGFRPNARAKAMQNLRVTTEQLVALFEYAIERGLDVRIHERGDFLRKDKRNRSILDVQYLSAIEKSIDQTIDTHGQIPKTWLYTHYYHRRIAKLGELGVSVYASCHKEKDIHKARDAGFELIAWVTDYTKNKQKPNTDKPKFVQIPVLNERAIMCPEQRLGRKRIQCVGCDWCIDGKGHVAFMQG